MGKYEVTNAQYTSFLNAVDPNGGSGLELYVSFMSLNSRGGILKNPGGPAGAKYQAKSGYENKPVVFITWYNAIRFANWMSNGQGGPGSTETGAYNLDGNQTVPTNLASVHRNPNARWFLPSENEWYKAAYYQPSSLGGDADNYWLYPTKSNVPPFSDQPPGVHTPNPANSSNNYADDGIANGYNDGFAVTGMLDRSAGVNFLTDVGAYPMASSFYGTFDQAGNADEWMEGALPPGQSSQFGTVRGGGWTDRPIFSGASISATGSRDSTYEYLGFRIAESVPEPPSSTLLIVGMILVRSMRSIKRK
jgi:formylglycine-generating enzyme required for sulfatase activity